MIGNLGDEVRITRSHTAAVQQRINAFNASTHYVKIKSIERVPNRRGQDGNGLAARRNVAFKYTLETRPAVATRAARSELIRFIREIIRITEQTANLQQNDRVSVVLEAPENVFISLPFRLLSDYNDIAASAEFWDMIDDLEESEGYNFRENPLVITDECIFHVKAIRM